MKKLMKESRLQHYVALILFLLTPFMTLLAQQDVKINGRDVGSWFERNWMWVAGGAVVLLIIAFVGRGEMLKENDYYRTER
ncbi:MAG: hypothetical protein WDO19_16885 [Bacteroidota bacterium]